MNSMSQQGGFQNFSGQAQYNSQQNRFQPTGFVQSHYQGGIKSQNAGPVVSQIGYSAAQNQNLNQHSSQGFAQSNQFSSNNQFSNNNQYNQPVIAHTGGYTAGQQSMGGNYGSQPTNAMNFNHAQQPVISHVGTTAGQGYRSNQSQFRQQPTQQFGQQFGQQYTQQAGFGASQQGFNQMAHASTQQNPVYQATNSAQQEGPVLSHIGGYSAGSQAGASQMGQFNQMAHASTQQNPVYQATNSAQQEGPVLSHTGGYSAGSQAGTTQMGQFNQGLGQR